MIVNCYFGVPRWTALSAVACAVLACEPSPPILEYSTMDTAAPLEWGQLFSERRIELQPPVAGPPLSRIGKVVVGAESTLFVPDGAANRILGYDQQGRIVAEVRGGRDGASKLRSVGPIAIDREQNLLVLDMDSSWINVLARPAYRLTRRFQIAGGVSDIIALSDGGVATYYPNDEAGAFKRFDKAGRQVKAVRRIRDEKLRIFHARVQNGGIAQDERGMVLGVEATSFDVIELGPDLSVRAILRGAPNDLRTPAAAAFPPGLSPYDYRSAHEKWWDSFTHIGRPYPLSNGLILLTFFQSHGLYKIEEYAHIFRNDGRFIAERLRVPHDGQVVGADGNDVYVVRNAHLVKGDSIAPLELYKYQLRTRAVPSPTAN